MKSKDLRREQLALLRFEKTLIAAAQERADGKPLNKAGVLASLAGVTAVAATVAGKLGDSTPLQYAAEIERAAFATTDANAWLIDLAEIASKGHSVLEALAQKGAFVILQAGGGTPKGNAPSEVVASLLTNGPF